MPRQVPRRAALALLALILFAAGRARADAPVPPALTAPGAGGEDAARALLARLGEKYRRLESYLFEGVTRITPATRDAGQHIDVPFRLAAVKPNRMRTEMMNPMVSMVTVSDGQQTWTYVPQAQQYLKAAYSPLAGGDSSGVAIGSALAHGTPLQRYLGAIGDIRNARLVREETLDTGERRVRCQVISADYDLPPGSRLTASTTTVWIDPAAEIALRDSVRLTSAADASGGQPQAVDVVTTFRVARVNEALPDSLFVFTPPPGAKLVDQFGMPGMSQPPSPLIGKPAPSFTLTDLAGKRQSLASLKGKVVLLDFWATWCGPCRMEMPNIVKLHHELAPKGLAVVAVNVGESATQVRPFLKKNGYDLPVWLDASREVATKYGATGIPLLVVIDRKGVVSSHLIGVREETELRAALKQAGID